MKIQLKDAIVPLLITLCVLVLLEIMNSTFFPILGLRNFRLPFHIIILIYFGFRLETPYLAIFVGLIQYVHGFFSIEPWAYGTLAGVLICLVVSYVRDLVDFTNAIVTIAVAEVFQIIWFAIVMLIFYLKDVEGGFLLNKLGRFFFESLALSILTPFIFYYLNKVWKAPGRDFLGEDA